jgi:formylglycine-generating enzyme required for sulfatase activity
MMKRRNLRFILTILALATLSCSFISDLISQQRDEPTQVGSDSGSKSPTLPLETAGHVGTEADTPPQEVPSRPRVIDGMEMVFIQGGEFLMGSDASAFHPERPERLVTLDEYWIDRTEVSNAQYRRCVENGGCAEPKAWHDPQFNADNQPALVSWDDAQTYCRWAGARLPTEAEWEKAARGTDGRTWPWGNEFESNWANLNGAGDGYGFTAPVGSFPNDASPYGLLDMAGNAAEWVADWYDADYYVQAPVRNPSGPSGGEQKVYRGTIANAGGGPEKCRCTARYAGNVSAPYGFRCASPAPPDEQALDPPVSAESSTDPSTAEAIATLPPPAEEDTASSDQVKIVPADSDWADIPVYPGADFVDEAEEIPAQYKNNYESVGFRAFKTEADLEVVHAFYLNEMPGYGWEKIMQMPMGSNSYISVWQQGNGQKGATISVGQRSDGLTHIGHIRAAGPK